VGLKHYYLLQGGIQQLLMSLITHLLTNQIKSCQSMRLECLEVMNILPTPLIQGFIRNYAPELGDILRRIRSTLRTQFLLSGG